jgi:hypothetical protein
MNWTKSVLWLTAVCTCIGLAAVGAWAQGNTSVPVAPKECAAKPTSGVSPSYLDGNGDGVCDNKGTVKCGGGKKCANYVDANGDGICDKKGAQICENAKDCPNYFDANGDGICDNKGQACAGKGQGKGQGNGACKRDRQRCGRN